MKLLEKLNKKRASKITKITYDYTFKDIVHYTYDRKKIHRVYYNFSVLLTKRERGIIESKNGLPLKHYIKVFERDHRRRYYTNDPFLLTSFYEHRIPIYMYMYVLRVSPRILRFSISHYQVWRISNHIVSGLIMPTNLHNNTII